MVQEMNKSRTWVQANDYLTQVGDILYQLEIKKREVDRYLFIAAFRVLYFLLERWIKEHDF